MLSGEYAKGDVDRAYELMAILKDSEEGIIQPYNPHVKMLGAVNRQGVTCYLDSILFAMFARLGNFEAMLYKHFEDPAKSRLTTLLRLWVNVLRAGKLITVDIVRCGPADRILQTDSTPDETNTITACCVWMEGGGRTASARCLGSVHVYYRRVVATSPHTEGRHLSCWQRGHKRRSQVRQRETTRTRHP